jgi:hypothetical protein
MAAEIIGTVESSRGKIFKVKWDSDSKNTFLAIEDEWFNIGKAESSDQAMQKSKLMVESLAKGRYPIFDDRSIPASWIELPEGFGDFSDFEEEGNGSSPITINIALAIEELLKKNKNENEKLNVNTHSLKNKNTSEVHYSESFIAQGLKVLSEMAEKNISQMPYGEPFNFLVVIGQTDKPIIAVLDVPEDLKSKIGEKAYIVRN